MPGPRHGALASLLVHVVTAGARDTGAGPSGLERVEREMPTDTGALEEEIDRVMQALPSRLDADPEKLEAGLAKLVLALIEFLRRVLEHQAVRRLEAGTLSAQEEERLGIAFLRMRDRMDELRETFGLEEEDLNLDLGPLGRLL